MKCLSAFINYLSSAAGISIYFHMILYVHQMSLNLCHFSPRNLWWFGNMIAILEFWQNFEFWLLNHFLSYWIHYVSNKYIFLLFSILLVTHIFLYQKGVYYSGIKVFSSLPRTLKDISSKPGTFKIALKHFLQTHSFYSLVEFFDKK